jgi:biotin transport system substrate-specific component
MNGGVGLSGLSSIPKLECRFDDRKVPFCRTKSHHAENDNHAGKVGLRTSDFGLYRLMRIFHPPQPTNRFVFMATALRLHSDRTAWVDHLRSADASVVTQLVSIIAFAGLTALGAQIRLYLWEVPFTLQTLAVYGSGLFLGWRNGLLAQVLYLAIGLVLPVYAGGGVGAAYVFAAASGGYLLAFPVVAAAVGRLSDRWNAPSGSILSMIGGSMVLFAIGVTWLHFVAGHATWFESIDKGWLRFIPADLAKILAVGLCYSGLRRAS